MEQWNLEVSYETECFVWYTRNIEISRKDIYGNMSHTEGKLIYFIDGKSRTAKFVKITNFIDIFLRGITKNINMLLAYLMYTLYTVYLNTHQRLVLI